LTTPTTKPYPTTPIIELASARRREARQNEETQISNTPATVTPISTTSNVIASITIELRRGGQISKRIDGVNAGTARRLTASLMRVLAEVFSVLDRK
jgi:hypothetical protein